VRRFLNERELDDDMEATEAIGLKEGGFAKRKHEADRS
jgi:hypothetical protein